MTRLSLGPIRGSDDGNGPGRAVGRVIYATSTDGNGRQRTRPADDTRRTARAAVFDTESDHPDDTNSLAAASV